MSHQWLARHIVLKQLLNIYDTQDVEELKGFFSHAARSPYSDTLVGLCACSHMRQVGRRCSQVPCDTLVTDVLLPRTSSVDQASHVRWLCLDCRQSERPDQKSLESRIHAVLTKACKDGNSSLVAAVESVFHNALSITPPKESHHCHFSADKPLLGEAALHDNFTVVDAMLESGVNINDRYPFHSPLANVWQQGQPERDEMKRIRLLLERGAFTKHTGALGGPGHLKNVETIKYLLDNGATINDGINVLPGASWTALQATHCLLGTAHDRYDETVSFLKSRGALTTVASDSPRFENARSMLMMQPKPARTLPEQSTYTHEAPAEPRTTFFSLPQEIRDMIYGYVFGDELEDQASIYLGDAKTIRIDVPLERQAYKSAACWSGECGIKRHADHSAHLHHSRAPVSANWWSSPSLQQQFALSRVSRAFQMDCFSFLAEKYTFQFPVLGSVHDFKAEKAISYLRQWLATSAARGQSIRKLKLGAVVYTSVLSPARREAWNRVLALFSMLGHHFGKTVKSVEVDIHFEGSEVGPAEMPGVVHRCLTLLQAFEKVPTLVLRNYDAPESQYSKIFDVVQDIANSFQEPVRRAPQLVASPSLNMKHMRIKDRIAMEELEDGISRDAKVKSAQMHGIEEKAERPRRALIDSIFS